MLTLAKRVKYWTNWNFDMLYMALEVSKSITKVSTIHPEGNINVFIKCYSNLSSNS